MASLLDTVAHCAVCECVAAIIAAAILREELMESKFHLIDIIARHEVVDADVCGDKSAAYLVDTLTCFVAHAGLRCSSDAKPIRMQVQKLPRL